MMVSIVHNFTASSTAQILIAKNKFCRVGYALQRVNLSIIFSGLLADDLIVTMLTTPFALVICNARFLNSRWNSFVFLAVFSLKDLYGFASQQKALTHLCQ